MIYFLKLSFLLLLVLANFLGCRTKQVNMKNDVKNITPNQVISTIIKKELVMDSDGDGVVNKFDLENNTPSGITVDDVGRSLDADNDGLPDHIDDDSFSTPGSHIDSNGRELDDDRDGIANNKDLELDTEIGQLVNKMGQKTNDFNAVFLPSIYFELNSSDVKDYNLDRLQVMASIMRNNSSYNLRVSGFSDSNSSELYNKKLDIKRAKSVIESLSNIFGIETGRMVVFSKQSLKYSCVNNKCVQFELY